MRPPTHLPTHPVYPAGCTRARPRLRCRADWLEERPVLQDAWRRTERGSARAACSRVTLSGILQARQSIRNESKRAKGRRTGGGGARGGLSSPGGPETTVPPESSTFAFADVVVCVETWPFRRRGRERGRIVRGGSRDGTVRRL